LTANEILGVPGNASEQEVRAAYLNKVKEFPPDRAPEKFEQIRDAYDTLRDARKRTKALLLASGFAAPLPALLDGRKPRRIFAGPKPWREVLKNR
jgi:curved DNA-binding protein CbpA